MDVWTGYKMKLVEVLRAGDQFNLEEGEKEERMDVWTGYKMKLVEVLRAGDQFNLEEDVSYDQILFIVEQLVKDKQQVDVANAAVSPKPSRKFVKENAELKKR